MPILSMFYGMVVRLYFFGDKQHRAPHVHAECSGDEAVFAIVIGEVLPGQLPSGNARLGASLDRNSRRGSPRQLAFCPDYRLVRVRTPVARSRSYE